MCFYRTEGLNWRVLLVDLWTITSKDSGADLHDCVI